MTDELESMDREQVRTLLADLAVQGLQIRQKLEFRYAAASSNPVRKNTDFAIVLRQVHLEFTEWHRSVEKLIRGKILTHMDDAHEVLEQWILMPPSPAGDENENNRKPGEISSQLAIAIDERRAWLKSLRGGLKLKSTYGVDHFVDPEVIDKLRNVKSSEYDLSQVIEICDELNDCKARNNLIAMILLTRALIDHVPPIFGANNFGQVAAHTPGTERSFKASMRRLDESSRKIADRLTHEQIRANIELPTLKQVTHFEPEIEILLQRIVERLS